MGYTTPPGCAVGCAVQVCVSALFPQRISNTASLRAHPCHSAACDVSCGEGEDAALPTWPLSQDPRWKYGYTISSVAKTFASVYLLKTHLKYFLFSFFSFSFILHAHPPSPPCRHGLLNTLCRMCRSQSGRDNTRKACETRSAVPGTGYVGPRRSLSGTSSEESRGSGRRRDQGAGTQA